MPEHSGPETDDLDATFRGLVDDVEVRSRRPGADRALRTAGVRRTATAAGALVVVLAVGGGFGGWALRGSGYDAVPAGPLSTTAPVVTPSSSLDTDVPPPTTVTLARLNAASAGWTTWAGGRADVEDVSSCPSATGPGPGPRDSAVEHYRVGATGAASLERVRFASRAASNTAMLAAVEAFDSCPGGTRLSNHDVSADLEVVAFTWGTGGRREAVWLVDFGNRMDVLHAVGAPLPSDDVLRAVSRLVAADVQVP